MDRISKISEFDTFPERVQLYIADILKYVEKFDLILVSIVLFGSLAKGGYQKEISDVDLVFVLDDQHSRIEKARFDAIVTQLEYRHDFRKKSESKIDFLYSIAENMTGMFISHFICFRKDYLNAKFYKVFNVNPIMSVLLAPTAIVWNSVLTSSKTIWGEELTPKTKSKPIKPYHVIKSMIMNSLLNILAYATFLLHPNSTKFSMEAVKWTLHSCYYCFEKSSTSVEQVALYFDKHASSSSVLKKLLLLRNNYLRSSEFIWRSISMIIEIHLYTLNNVEFPVIVHYE